MGNFVKWRLSERCNPCRMENTTQPWTPIRVWSLNIPIVREILWIHCLMPVKLVNVPLRILMDIQSAAPGIISWFGGIRSLFIVALPRLWFMIMTYVVIMWSLFPMPRVSKWSRHSRRMVVCALMYGIIIFGYVSLILIPRYKLPRTVSWIRYWMVSRIGCMRKNSRWQI